MKILNVEQTRALDAFTIKNEPVSSIDLMERASIAFTSWFTQNFDYQDNSIHIFCGPGNNGGDGLAIARLLHHSFYNVHVYLCKIAAQNSEDFDKNLHRLPRHNALSITEIKKGYAFPAIPADAIIIDGIFGSGLNREVKAYWADLITHLNEQEAIRVAIDIPSGLFADQHSTGIAFQADYTFAFEAPKLAFLFQENYPYVGEFEFASIGLIPAYIEELESQHHYIDKLLIRRILKKRKKYQHKGHFGHVLLVAGSYGMIGAAILSTRAALRSGAGLVSLHIPKIAYSIIQGQVPEAMVSVDTDDHYLSEIPVLEKYNTIGIGPGIGTKVRTINALRSFLESYTSPVVLDADALNIIAQHPELLSKVPKGSILTPHPKEFERLFGKTENDFEKNSLQKEKAKQYELVILLKGAHTSIAGPDGKCYFNATGNPGMATAGSGDVLTGMITALLGQGYSSKEAAILGVYLHGLAGDLARLKVGSETALIASDLIDSIGMSFGESLH